MDDEMELTPEVIKYLSERLAEIGEPVPVEDPRAHNPRPQDVGRSEDVPTGCNKACTLWTQKGQSAVIH